MRFKIDENLPEELSQIFRSAGFDCLCVGEQQLSGADDEHLARVCAEEERVLVTFDRGFSNIRAYPPANRPGTIVFRLKSQDKAHVLAISTRLVETLGQCELHKQLWIVHEDRIRIRST